MFLAWKEIRDSVQLSETVVNIYDQCLFLNPKIKINDKPIFWKDFIEKGITHIKHITYEVVPGFLSSRAVAELMCDDITDQDLNRSDVIDKHKQLHEALPQSWKSIVSENINPIHSNRIPHISIIVNKTCIDLLVCTVKVFYRLLVEKTFQEPTCYTFWRAFFDARDLHFNRRWAMIRCVWKPPDLIELDFKIMHHVIFTNEKLYRIKILDSALCKVCNLHVEDYRHMFLECPKLHDFKAFIVTQIECLFQFCEAGFLNSVCFDELILLGFPNEKEKLNVFFLNYLLSVYRFCIFKRRTMCNQNENAKFLMINFFKYTLKHYISYFHQYCKNKNMMSIFNKKVTYNNPLIGETNDVLLFRF